MSYASFIIPVRNVEPYLGATLASLQAQSDGDFEAIIVDDGSTDGTRAIADAVAAADPRFRVLQGEARGPGVARNLAVDQARGEILAFVDGDDLLHPLYLEQVRRERRGLAAADVLIIAFISATEVVWPSTLTTSVRPVTAVELAVRGKAIWRLVCDRHFFTSQGVRFLATMNYEDTVPTLQLILSAQRFVEMKAPLYFYRRRPNSLIRRPGTERVDDMMAALEAMAAIGKAETTPGRLGLVEFAQARLMTSLYRLLPPGQQRPYLMQALKAARLGHRTAIRRAAEGAVRARGVWLRPTLSLIADVARLT